MSFHHREPKDTAQNREDEARQLALELDAGVNRIRAVAAVAGSAIKRIKAEEDAKRKSPGKPVLDREIFRVPV